jgi:hypothetical protein
MPSVALNQLMRALARRWYVLVVIALVTVAAALTIPRAEGVYWSRVSIVFLPPTTPVNENALSPTPETLVDFAAIIERQYTGAPITDRLGAAIPSALYGSGVRVGTKVELVNAGGQWSSSFADPVITVDVVDESASGVLSKVMAAVERVEELSAQIQADAAVPPASTITTLASPEQPVVNFTRGDRLRATGGILGFGALAAVLLALAADRVLGEGSERRTAA